MSSAGTSPPVLPVGSLGAESLGAGSLGVLPGVEAW